MEIKRTFKYRIYPNNTQQQIIDKNLKLCRKLYNNILAIKIETYKHTGESLSKYDLISCIKYLKDENPLYKDIYSQTLQNVCDRIDKAFKNMFSRIKRKEHKKGFPRFKGENQYKSITYTQYGFKLNNNKLKVSKIGNIKIKVDRNINGIIKTMTIKKTPTNKYYVYFSCIINYEQEKHNNNKIGIDLGLNSFIALNDGTKIDVPKYYSKSEKRLIMLSRKLSHKKLRSNNRNKYRLKVALLHEKIKNQRNDFIHKTTTQLINNYSFIAMENLDIKEMVQHKYLSKSISDVGWGIFKLQLQYKAESAGTIIVNVDRFYPSTKTCSNCGYIQNVLLYERTYNCGGCGLIIDRDINAAKNILNKALLDTVGTTEINACGDVGLLTSMKQEIV